MVTMLSLAGCSPAYLAELKDGSGCVIADAPIMYGGGSVIVCRSAKGRVAVEKGDTKLSIEN